MRYSTSFLARHLAQNRDGMRPSGVEGPLRDFGRGVPQRRLLRFGHGTAPINTVWPVRLRRLLKQGRGLAKPLHLPQVSYLVRPVLQAHPVVGDLRCHWTALGYSVACEVRFGHAAWFSSAASVMMKSSAPRGRGQRRGVKRRRPLPWDR
jgi:hypothetical protein